jgi:hypothetical protein
MAAHRLAAIDDLVDPLSREHATIALREKRLVGGHNGQELPEMTVTVAGRPTAAGGSSKS